MFQELAGDASASGCYLAKLSGNSQTLLSQPFTFLQRQKSSTWRECFVIYTFYMSESAEQFKGSRVRHYTDNKGTSSIFEIGRPVHELQQMADAI